MATHAQAQQIENATQRIGRELLDRLRAARPGPWRGAWWQERMLRQFMADEWLKVQAFRFVDALPTMGNSRTVARHLREYFADDHEAAAAASAGKTANGGEKKNGSSLTGLARRWMSWGRDDGVRGRFTAWFARKAAFGMSGSFIAGSNIQEAEAAIRKMRRDKLAFTIDLLGEAALSRKEAEHYYELYLKLLDELPRRAAKWPEVPQIDRTRAGVLIPRVNVSVKITSIFPGFDPLARDAAVSRAKDLLRPIFRKAMAANAHVQVDMEHYAVKDLTLDVVCDLFAEKEFRDYPHLGVVLQAYLMDADRDVARMVAFAKERGTPLWIRLVKGAYWDSETVIAEREHWPCPVWMQKWQSDACYERCARVLIENHRHIRTAFASHNIRSLAHAIALRDAHGVPGEAFELQMLFGMGDPIKAALAAHGERCRIYTPYGDVLPGMAYLIRRLLENTANESFLRQGSDDDVPPEELLRDPQAAAGDEAPPPECDWSVISLDEIQKGSFVNIADTDFTEQEQRAKFQEALGRVRSQLGRDYPLSIGGQREMPGGWLASHNPAQPSELIGRVAEADEVAADRAVQAARRAFDAWRTTPVEQRVNVLFEAARRLQTRRHEFAAWLVLEVGKPWRDADTEVSEAIDYLNYYAHEFRETAHELRRSDVPGETNEHFHEPRGVVAVISPWNFPLALLTNAIAAPLVSGNTVIVKPSSQAAVVAANLADLLQDAGAPHGVLNFVPGRGAVVGAALVRHPGVDVVAFTGDRATGLKVNVASAENPTAGPGVRKVLLELGAKNAIIVDDDADLDEAIKGVLGSAFGYAGQKCSAAARVIVVGAAHDRFMERFVEAARSLSLGPAELPTTSIPPVISPEAYAKIHEYIEVGKREAKCVLEVTPDAKLRESGGHYIGPVIFDDVPPRSRIAQEEIFGPVVSVIRAANMTEAIRIFNDCDYALTGGIYSRSPAHLEQARRECRCGNFYINRKITGSKVSRQPFGGLKLSGDGARLGGPDYLKEFCLARTVSENTLRRGFAPSEEIAEAVS